MARPIITKTSGIYNFPFIVTEFDLSRQSNMMIHNTGDDFKVASFGDRLMVKKINGVIRNPETTLMQTLDFYDEHCIAKNYGSPLNFSYKNYSGNGYLIGMTVSLRDGTPGMVSLDFMELERVEVDPEEGDTKEYRPDDLFGGNAYDIGIYWLARANTGNAVAEDVFLRHNLSLSSLDMVFSSKLSVVDSKRNVIFYGENPVQFNALTTIVDNEGKYARGYNDILDNLKISQGSTASLSLGTQGMLPITVANITCTESSSALNYVQVTISAIMPRNP